MPFPVPTKEIVVEEGLILKSLRQGSAAVVFNSIDTNRHYLRKWLPFVDNTWKVEDTENFIRLITQEASPKRNLVYEIWYLKEFAGLIALKEIDQWNKKSEIGYWLDPRFEGNGIMTKCCTALLDSSFKKLGLNRIQIKTGIGNARSSRIPEKLGFRLEGLERSGEKLSDHYIDLEIYSMLKQDWLSK